MEGECIWEYGVGQIKGFTLDMGSLRSLTLRRHLSMSTSVEVGSGVCPSEGSDSSVLSLKLGVWMLLPRERE